MGAFVATDHRVSIMSPRNIFYASLAAAGLALPLSSVCYANVAISIDKTTQQMTVSVDGTLRYEWPVSTGRAGYNTPSGRFKPNRMDAKHFSKEYDNAPMPHSIFFDLHGHAIHGFFDTPHLGMAVSHGCVRLSPANAATLFNLVTAEGMANTTVVIGGHIPGRRAPLVARRQGPAQGQPYEEPYGRAYYGQQDQAQGSYGYGSGYGQAYNGQYRQPYYAQPVYRAPAYDQPYPRY
jgi:L,D-transpeptidase catalytic domain